MDGASIALLINDFIALYNNEELPVLEFTYKDYAKLQHQDAYKIKIERQKGYWMNEFEDKITPLNLPIDFLKPSKIGSTGTSFKFSLSEEETRQLRLIAESEVATMSMMVLSVLYIMLGKIANQEDIVIGVAISGRENSELENIIGMFPVVLPIRNYPKAELSFKEFLASLRSKFLNALDNQSYQYDELANELGILQR